MANYTQSILRNNQGNPSSLSSSQHEFEPKTKRASFETDNIFLQSTIRETNNDSVLSKEISDISIRSIPQDCCFGSSETLVNSITAVLDHQVWKITIIILTLIMLFGGSLQDFFPKEADIYFDIIFLVTMAVLLVDVLMMCFAVPSYFVFRNSCKGENDSRFGCLCFQLGSFTFWFDVISIITLFYNISFINTSLRRSTQIEIDFDQLGNPDHITSNNPFNINWNILLEVVVRTARIARLLRVDVVTNSHILSAFMCNFRSKKSDSNKRRSSSSFDSLRNWISIQKSRGTIRGLSGRGIFSTKVSEEEMHQAAIKIQRAWRSATKGFLHVFWQSLRDKQTQEIKLHRSNSQGTDITNNPILAREKEYENENKSSFLRGTIFDIDPKKGRETHIGAAMNEITMRRVAVGLMIATIVTTIFTFMDSTSSVFLTTMSFHNTLVDLGNQNENWVETYGRNLVDNAKNSALPAELCEYSFIGTNANVSISKKYCSNEKIERLREREKFIFKLCTESNDPSTTICETNVSKWLFDTKQYSVTEEIGSLIFTFYLLFLWYIGLIFFVAPVSTLVVIPIERMIRLLSMLVRDPLGYSKTKKYKTFIEEDKEQNEHTRWTRETLNGMETSFLMSTILRIGSLMKVGFGAAGVDIIRSNLARHSTGSIGIASAAEGSTVSCIFMFCDIRGFTDSSECLQEEVFVFTNRIAAVVHSYCHAYGGSANKNIGDAFLLSWKLDCPPVSESGDLDMHDDTLYASNLQPDKALISTVRICIALYYENFFLDGLSDTAKTNLEEKFVKRPGNLVQLGFGLHAGKAVEGAIGSERKLDATYLSNAVELSEYLESSTKKYGISILMSGEFHNLLHLSVQSKCRKIDDVYFTEEYEEFDPTNINTDSYMTLHTFDMDIDALFNGKKKRNHSKKVSFSEYRQTEGQTKHNTSRKEPFLGRMSNSSNASNKSGKEHKLIGSDISYIKPKQEKKLQLPVGTSIYTPAVWMTSEDLRTIRKRFTPNFFARFNAGYEAYISGDWKIAKAHFEYMSSEFDDKPSQHFLDKIKDCDTPRNFSWRYKAAGGTSKSILREYKVHLDDEDEDDNDDESHEEEGIN